jgi:hypothetical protein
MEIIDKYPDFKKRAESQLARICTKKHFKNIFGGKVNVQSVEDYIAAQWNEELFIEEKIRAIIKLDSKIEQSTLKEAI